MNETMLYIAFVLWVIIALTNKSERNNLRLRLETIISGDDSLSDNTSSYYLRIKAGLIELRHSFHNDARDIFLRPRYYLLRFANELLDSAFGKQRTWKVFGFFVQFILLVLFVYADAITIANNLDALGLLQEIPVLLFRYDIAVTSGSLLVVVVGALIANQMYGNGDFSDWKEQVGFWRNIASFISVFLIFSGTIVIFALGLARFAQIVETMTPEAKAVYENIGSFITYLLVPVNNMLATMLVATEGIKGFLVLFIFLIFCLAIIFSIMNFLVYMAIVVSYFVLDVFFRLIFVIFSLLSFFLFTPLDMITTILRRLGK